MLHTDITIILVDVTCCEFINKVKRGAILIDLNSEGLGYRIISNLYAFATTETVAPKAG